MLRNVCTHFASAAFEVDCAVTGALLDVTTALWDATSATAYAVWSCLSSFAQWLWRDAGMRQCLLAVGRSLLDAFTALGRSLRDTCGWLRTAVFSPLWEACAHAARVMCAKLEELCAALGRAAMWLGANILAPLARGCPGPTSPSRPSQRHRLD